MAYLTVDQIRERIGDQSEEWTDERIDALRSRFEQVAEDYLGRAFYTLDEDDEYQPREATETIPSRGWSSTLLFTHAPIVEVTELSVDDTEWTEDQIGDLDLQLNVGAVYGWNRSGTVTVTYTYGDGEPPQAVLDAEVAYVKARAIGESTDRNPAIEAYDDASGYSYTIGRADPANGRPTGLVVVDDALNEVSSTRIPGIA